MDFERERKETAKRRIGPKLTSSLSVPVLDTTAQAIYLKCRLESGLDDYWWAQESGYRIAKERKQ